MPQIQRPPGRDVAVKNDLEVVYMKGDDNTDGSIRFIIDSLSNVCTIEQRANGVWNLTELQLSQGSLLVGRETKMSAAGHHFVITSPDAVDKHIIVAQEFTNLGTSPPQSTILRPLVIRFIRQPDNSVQLTLTDHTSTVSSLGLLLTTTGYVQIGTIGASAEVSVVLSSGIPPNDIVFFQKNLPASSFPANSEVTLDLSPGVEFNPNVQINAIFTSPNAFTMRYDSTATFLWFAFDFQQLGHEDVITESLIIGNDLGLVFDNFAVLVRGNEVFA